MSERLRYTLGRWRGLALVRALYWRHIRRHETEICRCGRPVWVVWWCYDDPLWLRVNGRSGGSLCIPCFDKAAKDLCHWVEWAPQNQRHLERAA